jgi:preprotein translocase subunit YajC
MNFNPVLPMQAAAAQGGPAIPFILPMILIGLIFYFLVIRPQNKQQRDHDDTLKSAGKGDAVVTRGGIHGKIVSVDDDTFGVEIGTVKGSALKVKVDKNRIEKITKVGAVKGGEGS